MGLDMFIEKRTYVKNGKHTEPEGRHEVTVLKNGQPTHVKPERVKEVIEEMGYWRKANHIHAWFVANVQDGEDDCKDYWVSRDQVRALLDTVNKVIASCELVDGEISNGYRYENGQQKPIMVAGKNIKDPTLAKELLPVQSGFFFGGTDYDEYYYSDLVHTKKVCEDILEDDEGDIYYSSSW